MIIVMLLSCAIPVAATEAKDNYNHNPQVYVTGFASANIYYENDPDKKPLFYPIDTDRILGNLKNAGDYLITSVSNGEPNLLYTVVYEFLCDSFGMLAFNPDGTMMEGVTVEPTTLCYEGNGKYVFNYDSRKNPLDLVAELKAYIELVKADSGKDKIELVGSSYGVNVVTTYLSVYINDLDDIDSILLCVPSVGGIPFFGELLSGEFNIDPMSLKGFLESNLDSNIVSALLDMMNKAGVYDMLINSLLVPALRDAIYDALLQFARDVIATIPAIWVTIQDQHFESAMITMFGENYTDPNHKYGKLIETAHIYHNEIMLKSEDIILTADKKVEQLSIIAKYGSPTMPIGKDSNVLQDGLADVTVSTFGATCAPYGEVLPADYVQKAHPEHNFISADRCIDMSTALLPYDTWVLKGLGHSQKNEDYWLLIDKIVYGNLDITSDSDCPQFQQVSPDDAERLVPLSAENEKEKSLLQKLIDSIKELFGFFKNIIAKIFGA